MANKNTVSIDFEADGTAVIRTSDGIEKKVTDNNDAIEKDTKSATSKISGYWKAIGISAAAGVAVLAIKKLSASVLEAASVSEQYEIRLQHLLGSQAEGSRLFKEMAEFAGEVPFEYEKIMGAATQLSGVMKGGVDEVKQWMPLIGDLAAVSGLSIEQTTEQVVRMYSAGAGAADLFRERGITSMLGFQSGVSYSAEETRAKLMEEWNKQGSAFKGATTDLAGSWDGMISMLSDAWFAFRTKIAESGLFDFAKAGLKLVIDAIEDLKQRGQLDIWARKIGNGIIGSLVPVLEIMRFFHNGWLGIKLVGSAAIHGIALAVEGLIKVLRVLLAPLDVIFAMMKSLGQIETNPFDNIEAAFHDFSLSSKDVLLGVVDDIEKTNATYDSFKNGIIKAREEMERLRDVSKPEVAEPGIVPVISPPLVDTGEGEDPQSKLIWKRIELRDKEFEQWAQQIDKATSVSEVMRLNAEAEITMSDQLTASIVANNQLQAWSAQARSRITGVANQAMEKQMLSLIETGKFSVGAFAQIMAQQVKIELVGIAAKAGVEALYYGARGLAATAMGDPRAGAWFAAAGQMALIAGAALAAGAAVGAIAGGGAERPEAGTPGGIPIQVDTGGREREVEEKKPALEIHIHQNAAIIGTAEAAAFYEETLLPIMEDAGDRDVKLIRAVGNT